MFNNPYASSHYFQVPNPRSPYSGDIPNGLVPGKQIFISGRILPGVDTFRFDLCTPSGIAFHISPRFHLGLVVRNTERNGWQHEERVGPFPFVHGQPFELIIAVEQDRYKVAINGQHAFDYQHRIPYQEVRRLDIQGEIEVHKIVYSGAGGANGHEIHNPPVPFDAPIINGAVPGRLIQINGSTHPGSGRFQVNLQSGSGVEPSNIGLHFNPRWNDPNSGGAPVVIRNNRRNGSWGQEERSQSHFPFARGGPFEILIYLEHDEWKVAVNGQHFTSFRHRNPFQEITHIGVAGDVQIQSIRQF